MCGSDGMNMFNGSTDSAARKIRTANFGCFFEVVIET
jgi:hypothetical protein